MSKLDNAKIYQQSLNELNHLRNKIDTANARKEELSKKIDTLSKKIKENTEKKEMLLATGDISKISEIKKLTKSIDGLLEEKAFLTDIYNNFVVTYLAEIKHDLDILVVNGMRDRSKECLSILNDYAYEFKKLVNSQWDIYYSMTETTKDYHILNNELKAIYAELEIEMEPDVYSALTYPNITSAINILNPLRENMFKGFIPTENNSYFKL